MQDATKPHRPISLIVLFSILSLIIIVDACRKLDFEHSIKEDNTPIDRTEKFFTIPANTDARVKRIAERIKKQNDSFQFVNNLAGKIGFPVWNKTMITSPPKSRSRNETDSTSGIEYMYIPFNNDSVIDATLIIRTDPGDTLMYLLNDWEYIKGGFEPAEDGMWNAKSVFQLFSIFEKDVLGHNTLTIKDYRLFPTTDTINKITVVKNKSEGSTPGTNLLSFITRCNVYDVCTGPEEEEWCDGGCTTGCQYYTHSESFCFSLWVEDGWTNPVPPYIPWSGGGGGGNSPWYNNTCSGGTQCGSPGWVYSDEDNFLINYTHAGYKHLQHTSIIRADKDAINGWKANNIDTTGLNPCIRGVFNKLLDTSNMMGKILVKMDRANFRSPNISKFHIKYIVAPIPENPNTLAMTNPGHYDSATHTFTDTIRIRPGVADTATEIGMAQIIMHETMHAYLKMIFYTYYYNQYSPTQIDNFKIDTLFNVFIDSMVAVNKANLVGWWTGEPDKDHNFMADHMLSIFALALEKIDGSMIANKRYYWYLSWLGLYKTSTMQKFWPNYPNWPPSNAAPNDDSTFGLKYALTRERIDSIRAATQNETVNTANALGKKKSATGCYEIEF